MFIVQLLRSFSELVRSLSEPVRFRDEGGSGIVCIFDLRYEEINN